MSIRSVVCCLCAALVGCVESLEIANVPGETEVSLEGRAGVTAVVGTWNGTMLPAPVHPKHAAIYEVSREPYDTKLPAPKYPVKNAVYAGTVEECEVPRLVVYVDGGSVRAWVEVPDADAASFNEVHLEFSKQYGVPLNLGPIEVCKPPKPRVEVARQVDS